jgi:SEC-C motif-containing protein
MRSRYCAFAIGGQGEYLLRTWHPQTIPATSADELSQIDTEWIGLEIVNSTQHGDSGTVEFCARFVDANGETRTHHENSLFSRQRGQWRYVRALW